MSILSRLVLTALQKVTIGVSYTYGSDGTRLTKTVNGVKTSYTWDGAQLVSQTTTGGDTLYFIYHGNSRVAVEYKGNTYYYIYNLQGDVVGLVNSSGTSVVSYTYDAWGNPESISGSMASTLGAANPFRYRSYYFDTESGLYYLMSRYYDPVVGRFLNADGAIGTGAGASLYNLYTYCINSPVVLSDPNGCSPWDYIPYPGFIHYAVQDYIVAHNTGIEKEVSTYVGGGRMDLYRATTKEMWEVKPFGSDREGYYQLRLYLAQMKGEAVLGEMMDKITFQYEIFTVSAYFVEPGLILYSYSISNSTTSSAMWAYMQKYPGVYNRLHSVAPAPVVPSKKNDEPIQIGKKYGKQSPFGAPGYASDYSAAAAAGAGAGAGLGSLGAILWDLAF